MSQKIALQRKGNLWEGDESHWLILCVGKDFIFKTQVQNQKSLLSPFKATIFLKGTLRNSCS